MKNARDFKGIWIPAEIWLAPNLSIQQKVMWAEIDSLDGTDGCYATNVYLAKFFGLSTKRVSQLINELVDLGLVSSDVDKDGGNKRILRSLVGTAYPSQIGTLSPKSSIPIPKNGDTLSPKSSTYILSESKIENKKREEDIPIRIGISEAPLPSPVKSKKQKKRTSEENAVFQELYATFRDKQPDKLFADSRVESVRLWWLIDQAKVRLPNAWEGWLNTFMTAAFRLHNSAPFWSSQPFTPSRVSSNGFFTTVLEQMPKPPRRCVCGDILSGDARTCRNPRHLEEGLPFEEAK